MKTLERGGNPKSEEWRNGAGMEKRGIDVLPC
jgi:hypothetical protein